MINIIRIIKNQNRKLLNMLRKKNLRNWRKRRFLAIRKFYALKYRLNQYFLIYMIGKIENNGENTFGFISNKIPVHLNKSTSKSSHRNLLPNWLLKIWELWYHMPTKRRPINSMRQFLNVLKNNTEWKCRSLI